MKNQAIQYLALDVHQATVAATLRDSNGAIVMRSTVRTDAAALIALVRSGGPRVHVAFEEGTQAQWLYDLLTPHAERVVVCNVRGKDDGGSKSDRIDSDDLSERLRLGSLKSVYHGGASVLTLKHLVRCYTNLVQDSTRVMLRVKALFRGVGVRTPGASVYRPSQRKAWLAHLKNAGARMRAASLLAQLDALLELRPRAKAAMIVEARKQTGWKTLRSIPFLGVVRAAEILAVIATPHRFRTKRQLWAYSGFAVVTRSSADHELIDGKLHRRKRPPLTRGLNHNHNPQLKSVFKAAANAAAGKSGPFKDFFDASVARGVREELAKVTLARKIIAITLRLWKKGELWDPTKLTVQAT